MTRHLRAALPGLVLIAIGLLTVSPIVDPDLWWLLRGGQYMVETWSFPTTDPFSATAAGAPWVNHAWGFELILYAVYAAAGTTGLILMQALFSAATFGVLYAGMRREGLGRGWALLLIALGAVATRGFWSPRPQLVTYLLLAVFWMILRESRDGPPDRLRWLPVLTVPWVNLHGGFLIGPALIGLCLAAEAGEWAFGSASPGPDAGRLRRLALTLAGTGVAALVNPFLYEALLFPVRVMADAFAQSYILEWGALPFQHPQVLLLEGLILLLLVRMLVTPAPMGWRDMVPLLAFVHLGLQAIRNTPLLVIVLLPILGRSLADAVSARAPSGDVRLRWPRGDGPGWRRFAVGAATLAVVLAGVRSLAHEGLAELRPRLGVGGVFPAGAVEFLERHPQDGPLFNEYVWGGYLIWRLYPAYRVSIDGRADVYGPQRFAEHVAITDLHPNWRARLRGLGVRLAVIRSDSPLAVVLKTLPEWTVLYEDDRAAVLRRTDSP